MTKAPKDKSAVERGDAILRRMLQSKPKQHKQMVAERKAKRGSKGGGSKKK